METAGTLSLRDMLILIAGSGFFGGFVSAIFDVFSLHHFNQTFSRTMEESCDDCEIKDKIQNAKGLFGVKPFISCLQEQVGSLIGKALIGIAGAFGVILFVYWLGQIKTDASINNQIFLISLCIVAGTTSYRLLPLIGRGLEAKLLEQKIVQTEKQAKNAVDAVSNVSKRVSNSLEYSAAIAHAATALGRENYADVYQAIERLRHIRPFFKTDRTLHIYLGRLNKNLKKFDDAIVILRSYIRDKNEEIKYGKTTSNDDQDLSDAYFNIACYHTLKAVEQGASIGQNEKKRLFTEALEALKESVSIWPKNKEYARNDPDFQGLKLEASDKFDVLVS